MSNILERVQAVGSLMSSKASKAQLILPLPSDIVIVCAVRTPITRAKKGGLANCLVEDLLVAVFKAVLDRTHIDPSLVEDVGVGTVLPPGSGATVSRMALLAAGYPNSVAINTINRQCSSGLASVTQIANEIATGQIDIA